MIVRVCEARLMTRRDGVVARAKKKSVSSSAPGASHRRDGGGGFGGGHATHPSQSGGARHSPSASSDAVSSPGPSAAGFGAGFPDASATAGALGGHPTFASHPSYPGIEPEPDFGDAPSVLAFGPPLAAAGGGGRFSTLADVPASLWDTPSRPAGGGFGGGHATHPYSSNEGAGGFPGSAPPASRGDGTSAGGGGARRGSSRAAAGGFATSSSLTTTSRGSRSNRRTRGGALPFVRYFRPYALRSASSFAYWNTSTAISPNAPTTHSALLPPAHLPDCARSEASTTGASDDRVAIAAPRLARPRLCDDA